MTAGNDHAVDFVRPRRLIFTAMDGTTPSVTVKRGCQGSHVAERRYSPQRLGDSDDDDGGNCK